jgi:hypothetical protein
MSIFQVRLNQSAQLGSGYVTDPAFKSYVTSYTAPATGGGTQQRSMEVNGPNLTRRRLYDGQTFTSTNYWKRFASTAQGGMLAQADTFIYVVSDDGSPYSDKDKAINKMAVVTKFTGSTTTAPYLYPAIATGQIQGAANSASQTNCGYIDFQGTFGGVATYVQIMADQAIRLSINSPAGQGAIMDVVGASTASAGSSNFGYAVQIFDNYDLPISNLQLWQPAGTVAANVEVVATVEIISKD